MSTEANELATGSEAPKVKTSAANVEPERDGGVAATDESSTADESTDAEEGKTSDPQKTIDKLLRRIQRQSGKIGGTARERDLIAQENAQLKAQLAELRGESQQTTEPSIEEVAERKAREILHAETLNKRSAEVLAAGKKVEGFSDALDALREEIPFIGKDKRPTAFFEALLETDAPAKLIHHLGTNPDLAAEFEGLSLSQIGRRLAKLEAQLEGGTVKTSKAPVPIEPIKGSGVQASQDLSKMTFAEYEKARAKQGAGWSRFRS